jgi:hypothetical protein
MRKEVLVLAAALVLSPNFSHAAEIGPGERRAVRKAPAVGPVMYPSTQVVRLSPNCRESFWAVLLHCSPQIYVYPPYDPATVTWLNTLPPRWPKPYQQLFYWSRND